MGINTKNINVTQSALAIRWLVKYIEGRNKQGKVTRLEKRDRFIYWRKYDAKYTDPRILHSLLKNNLVTTTERGVEINKLPRGWWNINFPDVFD